MNGTERYVIIFLKKFINSFFSTKVNQISLFFIKKNHFAFSNKIKVRVAHIRNVLTPTAQERKENFGYFDYLET